MKHFHPARQPGCSCTVPAAGPCKGICGRWHRLPAPGTLAAGTRLLQPSLHPQRCSRDRQWAPLHRGASKASAPRRVLSGLSHQASLTSQEEQPIAKQQIIPPWLFLFWQGWIFSETALNCRRRVDLTNVQAPLLPLLKPATTQQPTLPSLKPDIQRFPS